MENKSNKFMENIRKINKALIWVEAVNYWFYAIIAIIVLIKALL
jgi:hypothetical protein